MVEFYWGQWLNKLLFVPDGWKNSGMSLFYLFGESNRCSFGGSGDGVFATVMFGWECFYIGACEGDVGERR